ncbi:MAG: PEGA domain-containing protein [Candidatus Sumerlaeia bacterium]|nr:PEGA domain-containing protein [Candidatus Sumerlaeia bacterium]
MATADRWITCVAMLVAVCLSSGCIRSRVVVDSEPQGAVVTMNGENLGTTPVERPFTWYWYYDFEASMEGHASVTERRRFRAPFYLLPGPDLFFELLPFNVYDTKRVFLTLPPLPEQPGPAFVDGAAPRAGASVQ